MAACMSTRRPLSLFIVAGKNILCQSVRYRWKPPDRDAVIFPTFTQRLKEWKSKYDVPASQGVNIGYHFKQEKQKNVNKGRSRRERKLELEAAARHRKLHIDLDAMKAEWNTEAMPHHVRRVAEHYGIYSDMFDGAHFYPVLPMEVSFDFNDEYVTPVYHGNVIPASETSSAPTIAYNSEEGSLWTVLMTSPDGNLEENDKDFLHWAICNIPGDAVSKGEEICRYLQPFPPRGAGFLRYVFTLFKQEGPMKFSKLRQSIQVGSLRERSFNMHQFYKENQDSLTPAGLSFFQSEWDKSVTSVFHNVLDMKEPCFEFLHPPEYLPEQIQFPHKEPFNLYMDLYRDVKDLQEEVLKHKLKDLDPTKPPGPRLKYPNMDELPGEVPSWLREKIQHQRLGKYHWRDLYEDRD